MMPEQDESNELHKDPNNWKWGIFYFNPRDKRTIVPKRIPGFGLTLNFASPYCWPLLIGTAIILVLLTRLLKLAF